MRYEGKWYRYIITGKKGVKFEAILGDWLKEGEYVWGNVKILEVVDGEQLDEFLHIDKEIGKIWIKTLNNKE